MTNEVLLMEKTHRNHERLATNSPRFDLTRCLLFHICMKVPGAAELLLINKGALANVQTEMIRKQE